jgi:predicted HAD superfamily Cof-like phosphohydrolase|tara:strand:- start:3705 stop:4088 length:384 start_codon:yes stop_codon:yes gene_type:complete
MKHQLDCVKKFHQVYKLSFKDNPTSKLDPETIKLRFNLMAEENQEYFEAANNNDLIEVADALGDMLYILCGTIIEHGMQDKIEQVFDEIQRSNMSKLSEDGEPIFREDGKVLKGPNYFKPNILKILS